MGPTVTTSTQYIVRREHALPSDRLLRKAAQESEAAGLAWELVVAVPPPALGLSRGRRVETLVVGGRAAQRRGLRVTWGRWNAQEQTLHIDDGRVLDIAGQVRQRESWTST